MAGLSDSEVSPMTVLEQTRTTLPSAWYFDPAHYQRELENIWYREWVCAGRQEEWARSGDFKVVELGSQSLILTLTKSGVLRGFHNTCRHRGSALCEGEQGRFPHGRIVCPYHAWTYNTDGQLIATPKRLPCEDFSPGDYSLYEVSVETWGGFVFVNLDRQPRESLQDFLGEEARLVGNWPLAELVSVCRESHLLQCNWKIFWENYSECYHCPGLHPELCRVVPVYSDALIARADAPGWVAPDRHDKGEPILARGMTTWSADGTTDLPTFPGLTDAEQQAGMTFATFHPTMYLVTHNDYVRSVRMLPRGPECTELIIDWMVSPQVRDLPGLDIETLTSFGRLVVTQDARACELNQRGLHSRRHVSGVLVPQEHGVWSFHQWVRERLKGD
jgi:Rieske 2Fe-2S family protein